MITLSKVYWIFDCKWMMENLSKHEYKYTEHGVWNMYGYVLDCILIFILKY